MSNYATFVVNDWFATAYAKERTSFLTSSKQPRTLDECKNFVFDQILAGNDEFLNDFQNCEGDRFSEVDWDEIEFVWELDRKVLTRQMRRDYFCDLFYVAVCVAVGAAIVNLFSVLWGAA